jgi:cation diffusion facilitator family transporter
MDNKKRYLQVRNVTLMGAFIDALLGVFKVFVGFVGHSQALIVDGVHSLSDLLTDFLVIIASKFGNLSPDSEHPYGHGRIETLFTLIIALLIIVVGVGFAYEAFKQILIDQPRLSPTFSVLIVALASVISKEWLYRFTLKKASFAKFDLGYSNAWHHRSDALTSIVVFVGAGASMLGLEHADNVAAVFISLVIVKMGVQMIWSGLQELIDTGVDKATLQEIEICIQKTAGVRSIHQLRTRSMGSRIFVDVHVLVDPLISVSEGHYIGDQVIADLKKEIKNIADVTIHIDYEDDRFDTLSSQLPNRKWIEKQIKEKIKALPYFEKLQKINLHYLEGFFHVELFFSLDLKALKKADAIIIQYQKAVILIPQIKKAEVWLSEQIASLRSQ